MSASALGSRSRRARARRLRGRRCVVVDSGAERRGLHSDFGHDLDRRGFTRRPGRRKHRRHRGRAPGSLPQTHQLPTARTAGFRREMDALWRGIRTKSLTAALPAFFPEAAYAQVKAISDPAGGLA